MEGVGGDAGGDEVLVDDEDAPAGADHADVASVAGGDLLENLLVKRVGTGDEDDVGGGVYGEAGEGGDEVGGDDFGGFGETLWTGEVGAIVEDGDLEAEDGGDLADGNGDVAGADEYEAVDGSEGLEVDVKRAGGATV